MAGTCNGHDAGRNLNEQERNQCVAVRFPHLDSAWRSRPFAALGLIFNPVVTPPSHHSSIALFRYPVSAFPHQGNDQPNDHDGLEQSQEGIHEPLVDDDQGTHPQAGRHRGYDEDDFFSGKADKDQPMM